MAIERVKIHNHYVYRDDSLTHRWYDAVGPNVLKYCTHFESLPVDDSTGDPTEFTDTVVEAGTGTSTAVLDTDPAGYLLMTCAGNEDDGIQIILNGEAFKLDGDYPTYFGVRYRVADADNMDWLFGLTIGGDTTVLGGVTDGLYFRSVDAAATCQFVLEKDSVEASTSVATVTDATFVTMEWLYQNHNVYAYVDGVLAATVADSSASFPNDEAMTLALAVLNGEAAVGNVAELDWLRLIQIRD